MSAARPLLYTYRRCPYAMRARMALLAAGVDFDAVDIVLRDKPQALRDISPKATVPVLLLPSARVLEQSWEIVQWALTQEAAPSWCQDVWHRAQTPANRALLELNDGVFKQHLDRYKYPERFAGSDGFTSSAQVREHHRQQGLQALLQPLEERLRAAPFLGGERPCATDWGVFPFVRQWAAVDAPWWAGVELPHVRAWLAEWVASTLFAACMVKLPSQQRVPMPRWDAQAP